MHVMGLRKVQKELMKDKDYYIIRKRITRRISGNFFRGRTIMTIKCISKAKERISLSDATSSSVGGLPFYQLFSSRIALEIVGNGIGNRWKCF